MNKDNAKDYLPLVQALADGKTIQRKRGDWWDIINGADIVFDEPASNYRIKPEEPVKKWRPFKNSEEFMPHRDKWICEKALPSFFRINGVYSECIAFDMNDVSYTKLFEQFEFEDGTPCGVCE